MLVFLILFTTTSWLRAGAIPISAGPTTDPTLIHTFVFGVQTRSSCSDVRSMFDILRSCFFTIAACVCRAMHPNIPNPNLSFWGRLRVTVKVIFYALMAPEMIILWALKQRFGAIAVAKRVNEVLARKVENLQPEFKWTQTHGHFAQMGGFERKGNKQVLYPDMLIQLLEEDRIDIEELQLTKKEINDKSKGDALSKAVVAFQTTWFMVECFARLHQGLPLIELEVVTLAFATLNAMTYGLRWHKPLNILCPIYLHVRPQPSNPPTNTESPSREGNPVVAKPEEEVSLAGEGKPKGSKSDEAGIKGKIMVKMVMESVRRAVQHVAEAIKKDKERYRSWRVVPIWLIGRPFMAITSSLMEMFKNVEDRFCTMPSSHVPMLYANY